MLEPAIGGMQMFAKRLKQLRKTRKFSMQEVAEAVGVAKVRMPGMNPDTVSLPLKILN